jgi:hypothetical protein
VLLLPPELPQPTAARLTTKRSNAPSAVRTDSLEAMARNLYPAWGYSKRKG